MGKTILDSNQIQQLIPNRYPMLLVDRVVNLDVENNEIMAIKAVTANEMQFIGHFPHKHVMPGVLTLESLSQTGLILLLNKEEYKDKDIKVRKYDKCRFKRQVIPGDLCNLVVQITEASNDTVVVMAKAIVEETDAVVVELTYSIK